MSVRGKIIEAVNDIVQIGPPIEIKFAGLGVATVLGALWHSFTSVLAFVLVLMFLADLFLGVLRAIDRYGLYGFRWDKFWGAFVKMGAGIIGIAVFTLGDMLLQQSGVPEAWFPLTTAVLFGMCWGFFWSAVQSFGYFFPQSRKWIEAALKKVQTETKVQAPPAEER